MEIERKFLVTTLPANLNEYKHKELEQGYISTSPTIRIRKSDDTYFLTIKGHGHISRQEYELEISKEEYETLLNKTENNIIKKTRYFIDLGSNLTAELDIYHQNLERLFTVEVEFKTLEDANNFVPPKWFGEDVSLDKRYKNSFLSKCGNWTTNKLDL